MLVLDEPEAGVDFHGGFIFCELLDSLRKEQHFTQLMVSHDLSTITHHATHVICLKHGVVAEGPPKEVLTPANLGITFGLHMGLVKPDSLPSGLTACTATCCNSPCHHA